MLTIILSGVGGQGIITAGVIIGEAVVIHESRYAVQTQSYGAEVRGGVARTDLTIADDEIYYPRVDQAHVLVALHQDSYVRLNKRIRPGGILVVDESLVTLDARVDARQFSLPIVRTAEEELKRPQAANMCMVGALVTMTGVVKPESVRKAIAARFGPEHPNLAAFDRGLELPSGRVFQSSTV